MRAIEAKDVMRPMFGPSGVSRAHAPVMGVVDVDLEGPRASIKTAGPRAERRLWVSLARG